jgi:SAM-dependent methyltransferase
MPTNKKSLQRLFAILNHLKCTLAPDARILDFGCGAGATVYAFHDQGFANAVGFDTKDYVELREPEHRNRFRIGLEQGGLPFASDTFDLVISEEVFEHVHDQVPMWRELHRIMKPGGIAIHVFPGPYCLIEPHNYVPFGGVVAQYWWYKLWAVVGVRNEFQKGLSAIETARRNTFRFVENLNYINNSCYEVLWEELGFDWKWIDQESFDTNSRRIIRWAGRLNRVFPLICWITRTFVTRRALLRRKLN